VLIILKMKFESFKYLFIFSFFNAFLIFFAVQASAQWSSNTGVNLQICDVSGEQALTKIAACPDGGCYISWFDHRGSSYAVYLQKLNSLGTKQFAVDGLLISNNPQNSSLVDYDLICDDSNNAVIAFTDIRNGGTINPFAYKISPAGVILWGANGVTLSDSVNSYQPNPKIVKTSDGNFVFVWRIGSGPTKIAMQKLNSAGVKQWGSSPILISSGTTENYDWPSEVVSDSGSIILYWCGYTGSFISPQNYKLYAQKFSSNGTRVWNSTQDTVYSLGRVSGFYTPLVFPDKNNGAIFVWQDDRFSTNETNSYVQRISSAGNFLFPDNGSAVAGTTGMLRFAPVAAIIPSTQETFVFWQEKNTLQSMIGVYGQKFSQTGVRLWNNAGVAFKPLDPNSFSSLAAYSKDTNVFVCYLELLTGSTNGLVKAFRTGPAGTFGWGGAVITPGSSTSEKLRMSADLSPNGMSMLSWQDNRNDGGIYAQNINLDGTFGNPSGTISVSGKLPDIYNLFQNYPNPFNPVTKIKFDIPSAGQSYDPDVRIAVFDVLGKEISELVNGQLKPGRYEIWWDAGSYPSGVYFYKIITKDFVESRKMILLK
jgi:hypothetical protein